MDSAARKAIMSRRQAVAGSSGELDPTVSAIAEGDADTMNAIVRSPPKVQSEMDKDATIAALNDLLSGRASASSAVARSPPKVQSEESKGTAVTALNDLLAKRAVATSPREKAAAPELETSSRPEVSVSSLRRAEVQEKVREKLAARRPVSPSVAALGVAAQAEAELLNNCMERHASCASNLEAAQRASNELTRRITELEMMLLVKTEESARNSNFLQAFMDIRDTLRVETAELQEQLTLARGKVSQLESEVAELQRQLTASQNRVGYLEEDLADMENERDTYEETLEDYDTSYANSQIIAQKNEEIGRLRETIARLEEVVRVKTLSGVESMSRSGRCEVEKETMEKEIIMLRLQRDIAIAEVERLEAIMRERDPSHALASLREHNFSLRALEEEKDKVIQDQGVALALATQELEFARMAMMAEGQDSEALQQCRALTETLRQDLEALRASNEASYRLREAQLEEEYRIFREDRIAYQQQLERDTLARLEAQVNAASAAMAEKETCEQNLSLLRAEIEGLRNALKQSVPPALEKPKINLLKDAGDRYREIAADAQRKISSITGKTYVYVYGDYKLIDRFLSSVSGGNMKLHGNIVSAQAKYNGQVFKFIVKKSPPTERDKYVKHVVHFEEGLTPCKACTLSTNGKDTDRIMEFLSK